MSGGREGKIGPKSFLVNYGYFLDYFPFFLKWSVFLRPKIWRRKRFDFSVFLYLDCFGSLWNSAVFVTVMCYATSEHCFIRCRSLSTFSCEGEGGTEHVTSVVEGITHNAFYCCEKKWVSNASLGIASVDSAFCDHFF